MSEIILLFDGVCNFCSASVRFIIKRDKQAQFKFAHLQSEFAQKKLKELNVNLSDPLSSMVLIENGRAYTQSTSALRIAKRLQWPWPIFYGFIIIPPFIRDCVYNFTGKRRYQWFGKKEVCWIPDDEKLKDRFIVDS